jgi:hypothetical protein
VRTPANLDVSAIEPRHFKMLWILEGLCRGKSYCWITNAALAKLFGRKLRQTRQALAEMHGKYLWLQPAKEDCRGSDRDGIFLHRRLDPDLPVEDKPPLPEAVERLRRARKPGGNPPANMAEIRPPAWRESAYPGVAEIRHQNKDDSGNEDDKNDDDEGAGSSSSLDDLGEGDPEGRQDWALEHAGTIHDARRLFGESLRAALVLDAIRVYSVDWVDRALKVIARRNRKPGNKPVESWGFFLGILKNWEVQGGPPPDPDEVKAHHSRPGKAPDRPAVASTGPVAVQAAPPPAGSLWDIVARYKAERAEAGHG